MFIDIYCNLKESIKNRLSSFWNMVRDQKRSHFLNFFRYSHRWILPYIPQVVYDLRDFNRLCFSFFLTLSYSSKINAILYPQGVSLPLKKTPRSLCSLPCNGCLAPSNLKKAPNGHFYMQRAVTPDQITQQNRLRKEGGPSRRIEKG